MVGSISLFMLILVATATLVSARSPSPTRPDTRGRVNKRDLTTNAGRFANGLPPLKPTRRYDPNRAPRSNPSSTPVPRSGSIKVTDVDGNYMGYISPEISGLGTYFLLTDITASLQVQYDSANSGVDLLTLNGQATGYSFGAVSAHGDPYLSTSSYNFLFLAPTSQSPSGSPPTSGGDAYSAATGTSQSLESAIWTVNPSSKALTVQWVNADGSTPVCHILYTQGSFLITADVAGTVDRYGGIEVTFQID